jgi:hypothetical protein
MSGSETDRYFVASHEAAHAVVGHCLNLKFSYLTARRGVDS